MLDSNQCIESSGYKFIRTYLHYAVLVIKGWWGIIRICWIWLISTESYGWMGPQLLLDVGRQYDMSSKPGRWFQILLLLYYVILDNSFNLSCFITWKMQLKIIYLIGLLLGFNELINRKYLEKYLAHGKHLNTSYHHHNYYVIQLNSFL